MSKAADKEIEAMSHLATEVDRCRPIDRLRVAELVAAGAGIEREFGSAVAGRVCAWLIVRGRSDTDEALHTQELRRKAKAEEAPPADPPPPDVPPATADLPTGQSGLPLAECDDPHHSGCEVDPIMGDDGKVAIIHRLAAAGA